MVLSVSERTFTQEVLESPVPILVDFWAPWCGLCRFIEPVLLQFQASCGEPIKLVRVNADQNFKLSNTYRLTTLPTLILFEDGKVLRRLDGFRSSDELRRTLEEIRVSYTDWRRRVYTGAYAGSSHAANWECRSA